MKLMVICQPYVLGPGGQDGYSAGDDVPRVKHWAVVPSTLVTVPNNCYIIEMDPSSPTFLQFVAQPFNYYYDVAGEQLVYLLATSRNNDGNVMDLSTWHAVEIARNDENTPLALQRANTASIFDVL